LNTGAGTGCSPFREKEQDMQNAAYLLIFLTSSLLFTISSASSFGFAETSLKEIILVDFENGIPCSKAKHLHFSPEIKKEESIQIDELKLLYINPVAVFEKDFFKTKVSQNAGDVKVPVVIKNPTGRTVMERRTCSSYQAGNAWTN
jgi:hypothetical protein